MTAQRSIGVGDRLPDIEVELTLTRVVQGAAATRDWYEIHHDPEYARSNGAPAPFLNTPTTMAWLNRLVGNWLLPDGRLNLLRLRMVTMNAAGDRLTIGGKVVALRDRADARREADLDLWIDNDRAGRASIAFATVVLPDNIAIGGVSD